MDSNLARCRQSKLTEMVMGKPLVRLNRLNLALDLERTPPRTLKLGSMLRAPDLYMQLKDLQWVLNQPRLQTL